MPEKPKIKKSGSSFADDIKGAEAENVCVR